ncbi:MAG TPA: hypothetical protein VG474_12215 [Solirubrobacteraceae bacterium]|nr:hypothetical protein [Solirubrobacteraceae bacterium]
MRRPAVAAALALVVAACGCGDADAPAGGPTATTASDTIDLRVVYDDGSGRKSTGRLICRDGERRAEGALEAGASPAKLCAQARGLEELLTTPPDKGRVCTQIYGGPETARITGTIGGEQVDRRFARTNGCEMADFKRAAGLLPP